MDRLRSDALSKGQKPPAPVGVKPPPAPPKVTPSK